MPAAVTPPDYARNQARVHDPDVDGNVVRAFDITFGHAHAHPVESGGDHGGITHFGSL
jgi:hypothetical protein